MMTSASMLRSLWTIRPGFLNTGAAVVRFVASVPNTQISLSPENGQVEKASDRYWQDREQTIRLEKAANKMTSWQLRSAVAFMKSSSYPYIHRLRNSIMKQFLFHGKYHEAFQVWKTYVTNDAPAEPSTFLMFFTNVNRNIKSKRPFPSQHYEDMLIMYMQWWSYATSVIHNVQAQRSAIIESLNKAPLNEKKKNLGLLSKIPDTSELTDIKLSQMSNAFTQIGGFGKNIEPCVGENMEPGDEHSGAGTNRFASPWQAMDPDSLLAPEEIAQDIARLSNQPTNAFLQFLVNVQASSDDVIDIFKAMPQEGPLKPDLLTLSLVTQSISRSRTKDKYANVLRALYVHDVEPMVKHRREMAQKNKFSPHAITEARFLTTFIGALVKQMNRADRLAAWHIAQVAFGLDGHTAPYKLDSSALRAILQVAIINRKDVLSVFKRARANIKPYEPIASPALMPLVRRVGSRDLLHAFIWALTKQGLVPDEALVSHTFAAIAHDKSTSVDSKLEYALAIIKASQVNPQARATRTPGMPRIESGFDPKQNPDLARASKLVDEVFVPTSLIPDKLKYLFPSKSYTVNFHRGARAFTPNAVAPILRLAAYSENTESVKALLNALSGCYVAPYLALDVWDAFQNPNAEMRPQLIKGYNSQEVAIQTCLVYAEIFLGLENARALDATEFARAAVFLERFATLAVTHIQNDSECLTRFDEKQQSRRPRALSARSSKYWNTAKYSSRRELITALANAMDKI